MDSIGWAWPSEGTKVEPKHKSTTFYGLKLESTGNIDSTSAPCNADLKYSYSKGRIVKRLKKYSLEKIAFYFFSASLRR